MSDRGPSLILKEVWGYEPDDDIETSGLHDAPTCATSWSRVIARKTPIYIKTVYGGWLLPELADHPGYGPSCRH